MTGIIGAMESEVNAIYAQMENKEIVEYNGIKFYKGSLYGKDVVVIQCGIGKVNAALCTQLLILKFGVDKVVNTGIAGATGTDLNIYDFVVSTETVYHDFDTQFFGYKLGQVPGLPETFKADEKLVESVVSAFNNSKLSSEHKIRTGLIASGDQFIAGGEKKNFIVSNFHPLCVEMEGCAVAHTCYKNNVPFVVVRCMSDCADDTVQVRYDEAEASALSSTMLLSIIKSL
ncbi:MAG: 5'-methylthioadenosine/adenosylhomocysteine nucleosidase [Spirochaetia bacterium]|nr:5'-methylthioadenosine/adenosylhomocysteine nucleosidase [Spirochaetia bacterium]MDD7269489.1 5'-methylthioadenosine/adenosylhomocysteine nucleosidase [Treponema sp.]MDY4984945.1 5'-methylthioadenosine/adenosylhomocysteine nucleosidase [Treponema sp.]